MIYTKIILPGAVFLSTALHSWFRVSFGGSFYCRLVFYIFLLLRNHLLVDFGEPDTINRTDIELFLQLNYLQFSHDLRGHSHMKGNNEMWSILKQMHRKNHTSKNSHSSNAVQYNDEKKMFVTLPLLGKFWKEKFPWFCRQTLFNKKKNNLFWLGIKSTPENFTIPTIGNKLRKVFNRNCRNFT